jgi:ATP-dependent Lhr-like helicase
VASAAAVTDAEARAGLGELVAAGLVTSDGFAGLRALIGGPHHPTPAHRTRADTAGRWAAVRGNTVPVARATAVEALAWTLLRRYGVVCRRLVARDTTTVPWRELARVYRTLEARGEIRGGRFVSGMSGEQFATADAVDRLREVRRAGPDNRLVTISAADPLNLTGIVTPGDHVRAVAATRIVYRNGIPVTAMEGDMLRTLSEVEPAVAVEAATAAAGRRVPVVRGYVGYVGS